MFRRVGSASCPNFRKFHSQASSTVRNARTRFRPHPKVVISSGAFAAYILWYINNRPVLNDAAPQIASKHVTEKKLSFNTGNDRADSDELRTVVWGSNKYVIQHSINNKLSIKRSNTLTMEETDVIRTPSIAEWLDGVALRDLAIHNDHAACVDSRGDVYQWGNGFTDGNEQKKKPILTLREKNITKLKLTEGKLYALSSSGKVYALSTKSPKQTLRAGAPTPSSDSWWGTGWFWGEDETIDFVEVTPAGHLSWGEKIVSIEAGDHHVLALTSKGRTFAHPVDKKANASGQLGLRKFQIPNPMVHHRSKTNGHLDVELVPKSLADPFASSSRASRLSSAPATSENLIGIDDSSIRFCTNFFEIPALKGVQIAQVAAGARTSFARTEDGRVLSWGANDFGQAGLGSNVALDTIVVPTEVVLWKSTSRKNTKCLDITAGGDLTAFTVERTSVSSPTTVDLLVCGNGRWGGLGSNTYSSSQSTPLRARNVSGLLEYSDATRSLQPITPHAVTISPTGHVLLTLNTGTTTDVGGRDLVVWGKNYESELGNGRKSSIPIPTTLETPDGGRFMLRRRTAKRVLDMHGKLWKKNVQVEQCAVVGPENSAVYWKIVSLLETRSPSSNHDDDARADTSGITELVTGLANISVTPILERRPPRRKTAQTSAAVVGTIPKKKKKKQNKKKKSQSSPVDVVATGTGTSPQSTRAATSSVAKSKPNKEKKEKSNALAGRSLAGDVSDKFSDYGSPSMYEEAFGFITSFLANPAARQDSACRLTLLQALIIELGLADSPLPCSISTAKAYLKSRAFLNVNEYLAVRDQGPAAVQRIMYPSRTALMKEIRKSKKSRAPRGWVKDMGLQVLLVQCHH
ncbi:hypothetical protein C0992_006451 [Termitomyces sp. T32_za158]|nr:hypothetical protein C0992_006451 [Termitomyces sp. T32_za158]